MVFGGEAEHLVAACSLPSGVCALHPGLTVSCWVQLNTSTYQLSGYGIWLSQPRPLSSFWQTVGRHNMLDTCATLCKCSSPVRDILQNAPAVCSQAFNQSYIMLYCRFVVYCCYQPRALATPTDLETKQDAYREYKVTTHWPAQNVTSLNLASSTQVEGAVMPDYKVYKRWKLSL